MSNKRTAILIVLPALLAYLIVISGHYLFGFDAIALHNAGVMTGAVVFFIAFVTATVKNQWVVNFESLEIEPDEPHPIRNAKYEYENFKKD